MLPSSLQERPTLSCKSPNRFRLGFHAVSNEAGMRET